MTPRDTFEGTWKRQPGELVRRYKMEDLRKLVRVGVGVPAGCQALVFRHGELIDTFDPGSVEAAPFKPSWLDRLRGKDPGMEIVYVYCGDTELECAWEGDTPGAGAIYSADNTACRVTARLVVRPGDPQALALEALAPDKDRLTEAELAAKVVSRLTETIRGAAGKTELLGTTHFETMRGNLEHALKDEVPELWSNMGLSLERVAQLDVTSSTAERILGAQAGLAAESKGLDLSEEQKKLERRKQQMGNLFDVLARKDTDEKDALLRDLEKDRLIGERELDVLKRDHREQDDDYRRAREQFVARMSLLNDQELDELRRKHKYAADIADATADEDVLDIHANGERGRDEKDAKTGQAIIDKMRSGKRLDEEERLRITRENEEKTSAHKAKLVAELSQHGMAALMAGTEDTTRAQLVAELAKSENLTKMTEEQILAQAAAGSPEVARAFQEKFKALGGERMEEMYDRMHGDQEKFREELLSMFNMSASTQRDAAVGVAQGVGAMAGPFVGEGMAAGVLACPGCGKNDNRADANFCGNCGKQLRGKG